MTQILCGMDWDHRPNTVTDLIGAWWDAEAVRAMVSFQRMDGRFEEFEIDPDAELTEQTPGLHWHDSKGRACELDGASLYAETHRVVIDERDRHAALPPRKPAALTHDEFTSDDMGNAERLVAMYGDYFKFVSEFAKKAQPWMIYDGRQWRFDTRGEVDGFMHKMIESFENWSHGLPPGDKQDDPDAFEAKQAATANEKRLRSATGYMNALRLVRTIPQMVVSLQDFDNEPNYVNVLNGVVDLRDGSLRAREPEMLLRHLVPIEFDPAATCPKWEVTIKRPFNYDDEVIECFQRYVGQALCGRVEEKTLVALYGPTNTGKSVISNNLRWLFGEYGASASWVTFTTTRSYGIPNDLAALAGKRFVLVSELPARVSLAMDVLKRWTGGDPIRARYLFSEFFEFMPSGTLLLTTNTLPRIVDTDDAAWYRILPLETFNPVPDKEQRSFGAMNLQFRSEAAGVFNWLLEGYRQWRERGLDPPKKLVEDRDNYRSEEDVHGQMLAELTEDAPTEEYVLFEDLWSAWNSLQLRNGIDRLNGDLYCSSDKLGRLLTQRWGKVSKRRVRIGGVLKTAYHGHRLVALSPIADLTRV